MTSRRWNLMKDLNVGRYMKKYEKNFNYLGINNHFGN